MKKLRAVLCANKTFFVVGLLLWDGFLWMFKNIFIPGIGVYVIWKFPEKVIGTILITLCTLYILSFGRQTWVYLTKDISQWIKTKISLTKYNARYELYRSRRRE